MRGMQTTIRVRTRKKAEVVDLTKQVADLIGRSGVDEAVPIRDGRLLLGTWQGIALVECDGSRDREVVVDVRQ